MIKTINLSANTETKIDISGGTHVHIENHGKGTAYVSKRNNIKVSGDGVMAIDSGISKNMTDVATYSIKQNIFDYYGTIYALCENDTTLEITTTNSLMGFNPNAKGGDGEKTHVGVDMLEVSIEDNDFAMESTANIEKI
ncbi:MAG: hypothetical protein ACI4WH_07980 [Oscillospiraceae bacterium]